MSYEATFAQYTEKRLAREKFAADNAPVLSQLATLDKELADFEGALKEEARAAGKGVENDNFLVVVQHKSTRIYDPVRIWKNLPDTDTKDLVVEQGAVKIDNKKLDELITAGAVSPAVLEGAITEEALTPAVSIKVKGGEDAN